MRLGRDLLFLTITLLFAIAAPAENPVAPTSQHVATPKKEPPAAEMAPAVLSRVQTALFQVHSKTGSAPAVLLTKDGLAVTSFHAIRGATSAVGIFADEPPREVPLELWAVEPTLDLAIVQIIPKHSENLPILFGHIDIEESPPTHGDLIWSPEFSETGFTTTSGVVIAIQGNHTIPHDMQQRFIQHATWIQTDCAVNTGNAGGPLINAQGNLVGINVWRWDRATTANSYYSLSAAAVKELLATLPKVPLPFAAAAGRFGKSAGPRITFPDVPVVRDWAAEPVATEATALANSGICNTCHGKGVVPRQEVVGERGTHIKSPIYKTVETTCPTCKGAKYDAAVIRNITPKMVEAFARAKPNDADFERSIGQAAASFRKLLAVDPVQLQRQLVSDSNQEVSKESTAVGTPVIAVSTSLEDVRFPGETTHYKMVKSGTSFFILRDPVIIQAGAKTPAIFGGLMAGDVERYDGVTAHVLKNGFVIGEP